MKNYNPRRKLDDEGGSKYLESDRDFLENNNDLAVKLLETHGPRDYVSVKTGKRYAVRFKANGFEKTAGVKYTWLRMAERGNMLTGWAFEPEFSDRCLFSQAELENWLGRDPDPRFEIFEVVTQFARVSRESVFPARKSVRTKK